MLSFPSQILHGNSLSAINEETTPLITECLDRLTLSFDGPMAAAVGEVHDSVSPLGSAEIKAVRWHFRQMSHLCMIEPLVRGLDLTHATQQRLHEVVLEDEVIRKYPARRKYTVSFAKRVVAIAEDRGFEIYEPFLKVVFKCAIVLREMRSGFDVDNSFNFNIYVTVKHLLSLR